MPGVSGMDTEKPFGCNTSIRAFGTMYACDITTKLTHTRNRWTDICKCKNHRQTKCFFFSLLHHWKFPPSSSLHNLSIFYVIFYVFNHSWCVGFCARIVMFCIVLNHHNLCMHSLKRIDRGKNQREIGKQTRKKSIIIDLSRKKAGWWSTVMYVTDINYWNAAFFLLRIKPCKKCQQSKPTQYHYQ